MKSEQLWARRIVDLTFEICCIPFHLYDLALGDVVRTNEMYEFTGLVTPSGHFTFRVWFQDQEADPAEVVSAISQLGASFEWSGTNLLAIDASDQGIAEGVANYLWSQEQAGRLIFETGKSDP